MFKGHFTDADRVVLCILHDKMVSDESLQNLARSSNKQIFAESILPKVFEETAQECYIEQTEAFSSMFREQSKYNGIKAAIAEWLFHDFNKK